MKANYTNSTHNASGAQEEAPALKVPSPLAKTRGESTARRLGAALGYMLFFLMLFVPTTYQHIKVVLLGLLLGLILVGALCRGYLGLHPGILLWTLFMVAVGLLFMLRGLTHGAPGALRVGTVYVLWPLVFTVLVAGTARATILVGLLRLLVFSALAIEIYSLSYLAYVAGWLPSSLYIQLDQGQAIGFYRGYTEFNLYSLASLLFLVPFLVASLFVWPKNKWIPIPEFWIWTTVLLGFLVVILSGRRALMMVVAFSPFATLFFRSFLPGPFNRFNRKQLTRLLIGAGLSLFLLYSLVAYRIDLQALKEMFLKGFDFLGSTGDASASARAQQFYDLLAGWVTSPLLGAGHGAVAPGALRSLTMPWSYELYYIALLFQVGIVGFSCYFSGVAWIYWMGIRMIRSDERWGLYMLPVLVGTTCFLIATATNPYLGKFDYMWVIFLPVALVNYWLLTQSAGFRGLGRQ